MKINDLYPSNYLKAADLQGRTITVHIDGVRLEDIGGDHKPVLYFIGKTKGMVLNKTNATYLAQMLGDETDMWHDKPIELYTAQVSFQGRIMPGLRVQLPQTQKPPQNPPAEELTVEETPF